MASDSERIERMLARQAAKEAAGGGCLMALAMLPFTALMALRRRK